MTDIPTRIFIVKVASRCNLACTYCYMYEHADQSWRMQPVFMSRDTVRAICGRLEEHALQAGSTGLLVVLHGGEPLLYNDLDFFLAEVRATVTSCTVSFAIQTNGTLFSLANLEILRKHRVRIGVSIDGSQIAHDKRRRSPSGNGTYTNVLAGLRLARRIVPDQVDSVLQVIDTNVHPCEMLDTLQGYGVGRADLLFPDLNHDTFAASGLRAGEVGHWLCEVFDAWTRRHDTVHIRIFTTIIHLLVGGRQGTDQLGAVSDGALMIETNGSYQIYDGLKTAYDGAGSTSMTVFGSSVQEAERLPLAKAFRDKATGAAAACLRCPLFSVCGGGSPIHRYGLNGGFDHESVFCEDLTVIISHIHNYIRVVRPDIQQAIASTSAADGSRQHRPTDSTAISDR